MSIRKRYIWTGSGLVVLLILLVVSVRFVRATHLASYLSNVKVKGPEGAPIHIVVYSDFQCPACQTALPVVEELRNKFSDAIQVEFRHFPLERPHRWASVAAGFAECAAEQGKFWEFHDHLYQEQAVWSKSEDAIPFFAQYVSNLSLDPQRLEQCLKSPKTFEQIHLEHAMGVKSGVQSTPTFFINGHVLVGSLQLKTQGESIVAEELKKLGSTKQQT